MAEKEKDEKQLSPQQQQMKDILAQTKRGLRKGETGADLASKIEEKLQEKKEK
jgi:hypothetical protein